GRLFHAVLLDIDHSPSHWLDTGNSAFYTGAGLTALAASLHPGGVFGLWSNDPPDEAFSSLLAEVFASAEFHLVTFPNPYTGGESSNTIYLAYRAG
ncbi:MAG: spermidine synthase, partial [Gammaproteobacteria bacterium]|nr:spermidine synthase [Gammaproteobacteria bacterium]